MPMEGRTPMVPREDLDTKRRRPQVESYMEMPRQPPRRTWGNSENYWTGQPTILLAKDARNNQTIRQKLRHVPTEQSGQTRTIRDASIERGPRTTMEVNRYGLHHKLTQVGRIWHDTRCHWPPDEDELFHSMQEGPRCTAVCNTLPEGNHMTTRYTTRHYYRQRQSVYVRIMEAHHGETQNRTTIKHGVPPTNGQTNRMNQWDTRTVSTSIHQLSARQLEWVITNCRVCIQQWLSGNHQDDTLLRQLRNQPRTSAYYTHDDLKNLISKRHEGTAWHPQSRNGNGTTTT